MSPRVSSNGKGSRRPMPLLDLIDEYVPPTEQEVAILLDLVLARPSRQLSAFLRRNKLPSTATKEVIRRRLSASVDDRGVEVAELIGLLDELEGWGNQHIYLYKSSDKEAQRWGSTAHMRAALRKNNLLHFENKRNPLVLPESRQISAIRHSADRLRIQWIETRHWEERSPDDDVSSEEVVLRAFKKRSARGMTIFDWDLLSGHAALLTQRLPSGSDYDNVRKEFERVLEPVIGISDFNRLRLAHSIAKIEDSKEALRRQFHHELLGGETVSMTSRGRSRDVFENASLQKARQALGDNTLPLIGNLYWQPVSGKFQRVVHLKLYPKDQRVGVFGACTESEVHYLLSRIRPYC